MTTQETLIEALKIIATMAIPYIALLRTRADLDKFAAAQRAKESGGTIESELRRRWYQPLFRRKRHARVLEKQVGIKDPK